MEILSNQEINVAFGSFDPNIPKRKYIAINLASVFAGYGLGVEQFYLLNKLKLVDTRRNTTKRGRLFLADYVSKNKE
jgi:hypothetical protein